MDISPDLVEFLKNLFSIAFGVFAGLLLAFRLAWPKIERFLVKLRAVGQKRIGKETLRTAAYERLLLFVHRIDLQQVMQRHYQSGISLQEFQQSMIQEVEAELEHNYTQQLYVSDAAWKSVLALKKYTIELIRSTAQKLGNSVSVDRFVEEILAQQQKNAENLNLATQILLKNELNA